MVRLIKSQLPWVFSRIKLSSHNRIVTSKSLSEKLILASTIPQNDKRLFFELRVQYMLCTPWRLRPRPPCVHKLF